MQKSKKNNQKCPNKTRKSLWRDPKRKSLKGEGGRESQKVINTAVSCFIALRRGTPECHRDDAVAAVGFADLPLLLPAGRCQTSVFVGMSKFVYNLHESIKFLKWIFIKPRRPWFLRGVKVLVFLLYLRLRYYSRDKLSYTIPDARLDRYRLCFELCRELLSV